MNSQLSLLPFPIGTTAGFTAATDGEEWEGLEFEIPDYDYGATSGTNIYKPRAGHSTVQLKTVRVVRNVSGISIRPGYLVQFGTAVDQYGRRVTGYSRTTAGQGYPVDEFLPSAGCANNDLCYITVHGPAMCYTSAAANAEDVFSAGSVLVALTAAASTFSTTAGRVTPQDLTGATALLAEQVQNVIGVALSASTTANSSAQKLVYIRRTW